MRITVCIGLALLLSLVSGASASTHDDIARWSHQAVSGPEAARLHAIDALGTSGDTRAVQPLLTALHDTNTTIRERAKAALRTLAQSVREISQVIATWINTLIVALTPEAASPPLPVERTQQVQRL